MKDQDVFSSLIPHRSSLAVGDAAHDLVAAAAADAGGLPSPESGQAGPADRRRCQVFRPPQQAAGAGKPIDILAQMMKPCLRIAGTRLLSSDITSDADDIGRAYRTGFAHVSHRMNSPPLIPT